ncbi:MAG: hypothetical protein ABIT70_08345 [Sulfuriferula sp.]
MAAHPLESFTGVQLRKLLNEPNAPQILVALTQQRKVDVVGQEISQHNQMVNRYQIRQNKKILSMRGVRGVIEHRMGD